MKQVFAVILVLGLASCGTPTDVETPTTETSESQEDVTSAEIPETTEQQNEQDSDAATAPENDPEKLDIVGDVIETPEMGRLELIKILDVNETFTTGPFTITITKIGVTQFQPSDVAKPAVNGRDEVTLVSIGMKVENTSPDTLSIYPDQGTIVVGQEQQQANLLFSAQVGGSFIGEVIKEGAVAFVIDTSPEDVAAIKYVVSAPSNAQFMSVGEELTLEFEIP
ncbi:MAG: hypothetical protein EA367_14805 [Leptolyngbya sp. DLM2.Bin15]|nr:MAG: hypothetical protein EA367_14805 [Leptolyngbya sp. DLM2.Bin15]